MAVSGEVCSLKAVLVVQEQPVSEEQAWALCNQSCQSLRRRLNLSQEQGEPQPCFQRIGDLTLFQDGSVEYVPANGNLGRQCREEETVDSLGVLIYRALDWGLSSNEERVLSRDLEHLICRMVQRLRQQPPSTINEIIEVCENRLLYCRMADDHYRSVCRALFEKSVELCNIKRAKEKLLQDNPLNRIVPQATIYWSPMWMQLMTEVKHGVKLKKEHKRHYNPLPLKTEISPFKLILHDLRHRRYTLRKVPVTDDKPKSQCDQLDFAYLRSLLRPATTRNLKAQPPPTPCLHEMLMKEIQTARTLRLVSSREKSSASDKSELSVRKRHCESSPDSQCVQSPTPVKRLRTDSQLQADPSNSEQSWETGERKVFFGPDSSTDISKKQVCSPMSTYVNVKELVWHSVNQCKPHYPLQIMRPFGSFYELVDNEDFHYSSKLLVQELVCVCQTLAKREMITSKTVKDKFCFCCQRELFFTWALTCHLCKKVNVFRVLYEDEPVGTLSEDPRFLFKSRKRFQLIIAENHSFQQNKAFNIFRDVVPLQCMHLPINFFQPLTVRKVETSIRAEACRYSWRKALHSSRWKIQGADKELEGAVGQRLRLNSC